VPADFSGLFKDIYIFRLELRALGALFVVRFEKLGKTQGTTEAGGPRAYDQNIGFEPLTLDFGHELFSLKKMGWIETDRGPPALCKPILGWGRREKLTVSR
jgi:hypothetical protein